MTDLQHTTTEAKVAGFDASSGVFGGLMQEMRELSKKKPDATLSENKVKILNRILADIGAVLKDEPEAKYLDLLDDEQLPQNSDAVLVMVQHERALAAFKERYYVRVTLLGEYRWVTEDVVEEVRRYRASHYE